MNKRMIWILSAALFSGASMTALASQHAMDKQHPHHSGEHYKRGHGAVAELAKLEIALKLEDAQRPAWNVFSKDTQELALARAKRHEDMRVAKQPSKDGHAMGALEHMDAMTQRLQDHQAHVSRMKLATQNFLAQLSPAQQSVFNAEWVNMRGHQGRPHHGRAGQPEHRELRKG